MGTLQDVAAQAQYGPLKFWAHESDDDYTARIVERETPGADGANTAHQGRKARRTNLVAFLEPEQVETLANLFSQRAVRDFQHPWLGAYEARIASFKPAASAENITTATVSITFVEHKAQNVVLLLNTNPGAAGPKATANSLFNDWDGMANPFTADSTSKGFTGAVGDFGDAFSSFDSVAAAVVDGTQSWSDLAREVKALGDVATRVIDEARQVEDLLGDVAREIQSIPDLIVEQGRQAVELAREAGGQLMTTKTLAPIDLFGLAHELYGDLSNLERIMELNGILDPFVVEQGLELVLPVPPAERFAA